MTKPSNDPKAQAVSANRTGTHADPPTCTCDNCGSNFRLDFIIPLSETPGLNERLDPGSEVPAGECRECGALCYIDKEPEPKGPAVDSRLAAFGYRVLEAMTADKDWGSDLLDILQQHAEAYGFAGSDSEGCFKAKLPKKGRR